MPAEKGTPSYGPGGRGFYGAVTVSERGQVVIPAQARRDLGIRPGDKLLVLGDPEQGLALTTIDLLMRNLGGASALLEQLRPYTRSGEEPDDDGGG